MRGSKLIDILGFSEFALDARDVLLTRKRVPSGLSIPAIRIPGRTDAMFALDSPGNFYLLIQIPDEIVVPERRLQSIQTGAGRKFTISDAENSTTLESTFATVVLGHEYMQLLSSFGTLAGVLLRTLDEAPQRTAIGDFLDDFSTLFSPETRVDRSVLLGLWGELWLLERSLPSTQLISGWHTGAFDRFDFGLETIQIEVKTTESPSREHSFSQSQLDPQQNPTWIASITAVADPSGRSVSELLSGLVDHLDPAASRTLTRVCLATLAGDLEAASDYRFSPSGEVPLMFFSAADVPKVIVPPDAPIRNIRFTVDLSTITSLGVDGFEFLEELVASQ